MFSAHPWRSHIAYILQPPVVINLNVFVANFCFLGVSKCFAPLFQIFHSIHREGFCLHYFPPAWLYFNPSCQWGTHSFDFSLKASSLSSVTRSSCFCPGVKSWLLISQDKLCLWNMYHRVRMACQVQTGKFLKLNIQTLAGMLTPVLKYSFSPYIQSDL